jgi:hypothetical protein
MFVILIMIHVGIRPFVSIHANLIEMVSLMTLSILAAFNLAASTHITGIINALLPVFHGVAFFRD